MKPKLRIIYHLAALINLIEAAVLALYFVRNIKDSFPIACLILVSSVSFSLCIMGLEFTFGSIETISPPEVSLYIEKKGFIQTQWFYLLHSFLFSTICLYIGIPQWIILSLISRTLLWGIAFRT